MEGLSPFEATKLRAVRQRDSLQRDGISFCPHCGVHRDDLVTALLEIDRLRATLVKIQGMAGNPDAAEACRLIIKEAKRGLA